MKIFEHKTLATLSDIDVNKIIASIDEGKKQFNIKKLVALLDLVKGDILISHPPSLEIGVCFESRKNNDNMYLRLFCKKPIMPTVFRDLKNIVIDIDFKNFDKANLNTLFESAIIRAYGYNKDKNQCEPYCINMVRFIKRIDHFLECNGNLSEKIIKNALYVERFKDSYDIFTLDQSLDSIEIRAEYKRNNSNAFIIPFTIKIKGYNNIVKVELSVYNMKIELEAREYENTSDEVIFNIIKNFCIVKNIEVHSIGDLKSQLSLLQIMHN